MSGLAHRSDDLCPRCGSRLDRIRISPGFSMQRGCRACESWGESSSPVQNKDARPPSAKPIAPKEVIAARSSSICPGVTELRAIAARVYGIRVERRLVAKLKGLPGLIQANPKSDLFCIEVTSAENSPEAALMRFKAIVAKAGRGHHFGVSADGGSK